MSYTPEQIAKIQTERPNLWRVACEMSKSHKAADTLLVIAGPMLKQEQEEDMQV